MRVWILVLASCGRIQFDPVDVSACSGAGLVCADSVTAVTCNGRCWAWCHDLVDHAQAVARCTAWGGTLMPLSTVADAACFRTTVVPTDSPWLGLEQASSSPAADVGWSWNGDGLPLDYTRWDSTQPDDGNGGVEIGHEQCVRARDGTADWFDVQCSDSYIVACAQ